MVQARYTTPIQKRLLVTGVVFVGAWMHYSETAWIVALIFKLKG